MWCRSAWCAESPWPFANLLATCLAMQAKFRGLYVSDGAVLLGSLKGRLESIQEIYGYPLTVRSVILFPNPTNMSLAATQCPAIEIMQGSDDYNHEACGNIEKQTNIILRLVAAKDKDDQYMEDFKSCVIRCIYGNSFTAAGNTGINLSSGVVHPRVISTEPDYGYVSTNRVYAMLVQFICRTQSWRF